MDQLFDITVTDDLPFSVTKKPRRTDKLLTLYKLTDGESVTYNQLRAAYFRKFNEEIMLNNLSAANHKLIKQGWVKKLSAGSFMYTAVPYPKSE